MQTLVLQCESTQHLENNGWSHSEKHISPESFKSAFWCEILIGLNRTLAHSFCKSFKKKRKPLKIIMQFAASECSVTRAIVHLRLLCTSFDGSVLTKCSWMEKFKLRNWRGVKRGIKSLGHFRSASPSKERHKHTLSLKHSSTIKNCSTQREARRKRYSQWKTIPWRLRSDWLRHCFRQYPLQNRANKH